MLTRVERGDGAEFGEDAGQMLDEEIDLRLGVVEAKAETNAAPRDGWVLSGRFARKSSIRVHIGLLARLSLRGKMRHGSG